MLTILLSEQLIRYELRHLPMVSIWQMRLTTVVHQTRVPACLVGRRPAAMTLHRLGQLNLPGRTKTADDETAAECKPKGVILVSEAFTEINAGLVIVLASGHESPVPITVLEDPDTDPDEIAHVITSAYHRHVEAYLATTYPPVDVEPAVASGLLGSPLLGTSTWVTADWCHAWSVLGQWSG